MTKKRACIQPISTNFSIVFPTHRWEWIRTVLDSIFDNAKYEDKIDIQLAVNIGDRIIPIIQEYQKKHPTVYYHEIDHVTMTYGNNFVGIVPYVNLLAFNYAKGKYIIPMNDDALFTSKNWDEKALKVLENFISPSNGVVLGITEDFMVHPGGFNGTGCPVSAFPIISREGIEYFGFLFSTEFFHNTADCHICYCYWKEKRTVDLKNELKVRHRPPELTDYIFEGGEKEILKIKESKMQRVPIKELEDFWKTQDIPKVKSFLDPINGRPEIWDIAFKEASKVEGLYYDFGSGVTTTPQLAKFIPNKILYAFDSFEGMSEDFSDRHKKGAFTAPEAAVLLNEIENIRIVKGYYEDTLDTFFKENTLKIAFIHLDCVLHSSTKCIFDNLIKYDKIQIGSVFMFNNIFYYEDNYWYNSDFLLFNELIKNLNLEVEYLAWAGFCHCSYKVIGEKN